MIAMACTVLVVAPTFRQRAWRHYRASLFVLFALVGFFPLFHSIKLYGLAQAELLMGWSWFANGGLTYLSGATIYAVCDRSQTKMRQINNVSQARIPERLKPGRFDVWGSSHQIFHVAIILAALMHFKGILVSLDYRHDPVVGITRQCMP